MIPTRLGDLLKGVSFTKNPNLMIRSVVTDSRLATPGSVFVAIVGDRLDGNDYAQDAVARGAEAVVVSRNVSVTRGEQILARNTKDAYIEMAGNYRRQFGPKIAGVTGSVGKTTTKEMIAVIFESFGPTLKNKGNKNNEIGLPETLFEMDSATELAVLEMGMSALGDIHKLTVAAQPSAAIITGIGISHIEALGSKENILKAKLEIIDGMPPDGILVMNGDDDLLMSARIDIPLTTATFGIRTADSDVTALNIMIRETTTEFTLKDRLNGSFEALLPCIGNHNILDALAAYTVATRMGLDPARCVAALKDYVPAGMRQRFIDFNGITVIEDCYNANPDSMKAALTTLSKLHNNGIRIAVLGDMLELGDYTFDSHRDLGIEAARLGIDILLCYGDNMEICVEAAKAAKITSAEHFKSKEKMVEYLKNTVHSGDAVLFKASRAIALEEVIEEFYKCV